MAKLYKIHHGDKSQLLIENLEMAESFFARGKGLLGKKSLDAQSALWIKPCNNIHTCFMNFAIDCIFVNKKMEIVKVVSGVKPYKIVGPYWKSFSVFETASGLAEKWNLQVGDQLYVVN
ncbi:hypothetical protein CIK05_02450 [Bdellovibrio sp. qaytius]|nr:hypothetical protein CIK05_02450 [Bdellovibrio sp. qaytius]